MYNMLELCTCGCVRQVHELARGKCGNPNCPTMCGKFISTSVLHKSAYCSRCELLLEDCECFPQKINTFD